MRRALGDARFEAAWEAGRTGDAREAVSAALATLATDWQVPPAAPLQPRDSHTLTPRELEVLHLVASGRSNREVADALVLSVRTVERHITNIYAKIGARGKADATAYAFRHGLI